MKILELRFKNLNSLYGEWFIDFSDPEYSANGIFVLTGPTGGGKSTILDGICLALYGATPRLGRITKSSNEIMSRGTGECYAEVLFESQAGRFRSHWSQHRARKKSSGKLADAKHEISNGDSGEVIETKKSLIGAIVEAKTGMDFDRFTRSILLAQGGFDTFLKADSEQKSKILEQITGTEMYTEISRSVHEKQKDEKEKLNLLLAEISGISLLSTEEGKEIELELQEKETKETELIAGVARGREKLAWLTSIINLEKEILSFTEESDKLKVDLKAFQPKREQLKLALKAAELDGEYATITALRKEQVRDNGALEKEESDMPTLESSALSYAKELEVAEEQVAKAKKQLQEEMVLIQKVRTLDQNLADLQKKILELEDDYKKEEKQIKKQLSAKKKEQKQYDGAAAKLKDVSQYLQNNVLDERLVSELTGIEEQLNSFLQKQDDIKKLEKQGQKVEKALKAAKEKLDVCQKDFADKKITVQGVENSLVRAKKDCSELLDGRLLREYRAEKESLFKEKSYLDQIAKLKDHRKKLEDGKPCPLCGAKEHPFGVGNIPVPDEIEKKIEAISSLIEEVEKQEESIKDLEEQEKKARSKLVVGERGVAVASSELKIAEKDSLDTFTRIKELSSLVEEQKIQIHTTLKSLNYKLDEENPEMTVALLKERRDSWLEQVKNKEKIEKQLLALSGEVKRLESVIETKNIALAEKKHELQNMQQNFEEAKKERKELFTEKDPGEEEKRLNTTFSEAESQEKQARENRDKAKENLQISQTRLLALREQISERSTQLKQLEKKLDSNLQLTGFADEKKYLEACLSGLERDELSKIAATLDDREKELAAKRKDRKERLAEEKAKQLTDKTHQEMVPYMVDLEEALKQLRDKIAGLKQKITDNNAAADRIKEKQKVVEGQKRECGRWEKLHILIGSADGKKYRNFAQGLTFERVVAHANKQLQEMTDRYLLIRDDNSPLELNVVDNYQAGEIRSIKNLSGGESFVVSLALALGLSRMASRKVRVDSLFLDEGFGTLDEEALETALEALAGLHQESKLIGVISHVPALKERITTQISITPISGGRSIVSGPGCTQK